MKKPILLVTAAMGLLMTLPLLISNCRKANVNRDELDATALMAGARAFVSNEVQNQRPTYQTGNPRNDRTQRSRDIVWPSAIITTFRGRPAVVAPLHFEKDLFLRTRWGGNNNFRLENQARLLVYQDTAKTWHAEVVTTLPDTGYLNAGRQRFSGMILVDDWWGNPINKYLFTADGRVERYMPEQNQDASAAPKHITKVTPDVVVQICSYIYGYNYAPGAEDDGEYWEEFVGCTFMYAPDEGSGGGGGSAYNGVETGGDGTSVNAGTIAVSPPGNRIVNLADYLKCFTNVGGNDHTYMVTICVDQPVAGSRTPWKVTDGGPSGSSTAGNIVDVGHTFLYFTEQYGATTITRNVGFYPSGTVSPLNPASPGVLANNEDHPYNISATFKVTNAQFFIMLNSLQRATTSSFYYNLNSENCTSFALQTIAQGGIFLPNTIGTWYKGSGCDPGDLGEDIRQMALLPNMTKATSPTFHFNVGSCQ